MGFAVDGNISSWDFGISKTDRNSTTAGGNVYMQVLVVIGAYALGFAGEASAWRAAARRDMCRSLIRIWVAKYE